MAKKKKDAAAGDSEGAAAKPPSKGKSMLTGAVLMLIGMAAYKFVLAGSPTQTVLVAAPIDAVAGAHGATSAADCSAVAAEAAAASASGAKPHARSGGGGAAGATVALSEMTINLADTDAAHYLKVGIALELGKGVVAEEFEQEKAKASDVAVRYFSQKTSAQLQGPSAIETAKNELTCLMQVAYADPAEEGDKKKAKAAEPKVASVLFTQFLMQ